MAKNNKEPEPNIDKEAQAISRLWKKVQEKNDAIMAMKSKINEIKNDLKVAKSSLEQLQESQEKFIMENHEIQLGLFDNLESDIIDPEKWRDMPLMALNMDFEKICFLTNHFKTLGELDDFIHNKSEKEIDDALVTQETIDTAFESLTAFIQDWKSYADKKRDLLAKANKSNEIDELVDDEDLDDEEEDDDEL